MNTKFRKSITAIAFLLIAALIFWNIRIELDGIMSKGWIANIFNKFYLRFDLGDISLFNIMVIFWLGFILFKINGKIRGMKIFSMITAIIACAYIFLDGRSPILAVILLMLTLVTIVMLAWKKIAKTAIYVLLMLVVSVLYLIGVMVHSPQLIPFDSLTTIVWNKDNPKEEIVLINRFYGDFLGRTVEKNFILKRFSVVSNVETITGIWEIKDQELFEKHLPAKMTDGEVRRYAYVNLMNELKDALKCREIKYIKMHGSFGIDESEVIVNKSNLKLVGYRESEKDKYLINGQYENRSYVSGKNFIVKSSNDIIIEGLFFLDVKLKLKDCRNIKIVNCKFLSNFNSAIRVLKGSENIEIVNCSFEDGEVAQKFVN